MSEQPIQSKTHKLATTWYFYSLQLGSAYDEKKCEIPIETVEDLWEIVRKIPHLEKINGYNIAFFKDPFRPHYDDISTYEISIFFDKKDQDVYLKILAYVVGGQFDHLFNSEGFRGVYIITKKKNNMAFSFWFDPLIAQNRDTEIRTIIMNSFPEFQLTNERFKSENHMIRNKIKDDDE